MAFALPVAAAIMLMLWLLLAFAFCPRHVAALRVPAAPMRRKYAALGPLSAAEIEVAVVFVVMATLWLTRHAWSEAFYDGKVKDGKELQSSVRLA